MITYLTQYLFDDISAVDAVPLGALELKRILNGCNPDATVVVGRCTNDVIRS